MDCRSREQLLPRRVRCIENRSERKFTLRDFGINFITTHWEDEVEGDEVEDDEFELHLVWFLPGEATE